MINSKIVAQIFHLIDSNSDFFAIKDKLNDCSVVLSGMNEHDLRETLFAYSMIYRDRIDNEGSSEKIIHLITCFWYVYMQLIAIKKEASFHPVWKSDDFRVAILQSIRVISSQQHSLVDQAEGLIASSNWVKYVNGEKYSERVNAYISENSDKYSIGKYGINTDETYLSPNQKTIRASLYDHPYFLASCVILNREDAQVKDIILDLK